MTHSWTWKALERVRHLCKLFATQLEENHEEEEPIVSMTRLARTTLAEKRIIDIFARCMTKIDKRKEVQSLRIELKAHDLRFGQLGQSHREARGGSASSEVGFMFTRRALEHRPMPEVLIFVHSSVEHPVVERCFYFSPVPLIPQDIA